MDVIEADRYLGGRGLDPAAAALSALVAGSLFAALVFIAPKIVGERDRPLIIRSYTLPPEPRPLPTPQAQPKAAQPHKLSSTPLTAPQPLVPIDTPSELKAADPSPPPPIDLWPGSTTGTPPAPPPAQPLLVDASVDPRFAGAFQPPYPPEETRAEREGLVVIRILIGTDGRVKQAQRMSATSDAFWRVTERRALTAWRFRPATRDGVPEERWRTMRVRFELNESD